MKIDKFEDLEAWKKARELCKMLYQVTSLGGWSRDFALKDQIRRAGISVISNIAEGFERGGDKEFRQFLSVAKGSVGEVRAQLYVAVDAGYLTLEHYESIKEHCLSTSRLIAGLMRYLQNSDYSGTKYKDDRVKDSIGSLALDLGLRTLD